jgi:hypothetical protein
MRYVYLIFVPSAALRRACSSIVASRQQRTRHHNIGPDILEAIRAYFRAVPHASMVDGQIVAVGEVREEWAHQTVLLLVLPRRQRAVPTTTIFCLSLYLVLIASSTRLRHGACEEAAPCLAAKIDAKRDQRRERVALNAHQEAD